MHTRAVLHVLQLNTFRVSLQKWIREHKEDYRGDRIEDFQDKYLQKVFAGEKYFTGAETQVIFHIKVSAKIKVLIVQRTALARSSARCSSSASRQSPASSGGGSGSYASTR